MGSSDDEGRLVTWRDLLAEIRSVKQENRILLLSAIIVLKFDVPDPVTVTAIVGVTLKAMWSAWFGRL